MQMPAALNEKKENVNYTPHIDRSISGNFEKGFQVCLLTCLQFCSFFYFHFAYDNNPCLGAAHDGGSGMQFARKGCVWHTSWMRLRS